MCISDIVQLSFISSGIKQPDFNFQYHGIDRLLRSDFWLDLNQSFAHCVHI